MSFDWVYRGGALIVVKFHVIRRAQYGSKANFFTKIVVNRFWIGKSRRVTMYLNIMEVTGVNQGEYISNIGMRIHLGNHVICIPKLAN